MPLIVSWGEDGAALYARIMSTAMAGAFIWLALATKYSLPVSTSHSLVGGIVGLGLYSTGSARWGTVLGIGKCGTNRILRHVARVPVRFRNHAQPSCTRACNLNAFIMHLFAPSFHRVAPRSFILDHQPPHGRSPGIHHFLSHS